METLAGFLPPRISRERAGRLVSADSRGAESEVLVSSSDLGGTDMKGTGGPVGFGVQEAVSQRIDLFTQKVGSAVV